MKTILIFCAVGILLATRSFAAEPLPEYITKAQSIIEQANSKAAGLNDFADAVLIGQNYLRRAEAEYKKNLSWGKLDPKAESTVHYYADMARIQASIVLSQLGKIEQEKEQLRLKALTNEVKAKVKVFDDKVAAISALNATTAEQKKMMESKEAEISQLSGRITLLTADLSAKSAALAAAELKIIDGASELKVKQATIAALEQKVTDGLKNLDASKGEITRLRGELSALALQKGAAESQSQEQIQALKRSQDFVAEVGKLGGVIKTGSDNMTVIFGRSTMLKSPKNDTLTVDGDKAVGRIADLLKAYPEFRVIIKIHGFGKGKTEDATGTDHMARVIREVLLAKGVFEPATVEALGVGVAEPIYPKSNPDGNKRVEVTFIKR